MEGATRSSVDDPPGRCRRKTSYGGFWLISVHPRPDGSGYGDLTPPLLFDTHYHDRRDLGGVSRVNAEAPTSTKSARWTRD
jgi:hypothetical protein